MPDKVIKTKKISKDEAMELRKDHLKSFGRDTAVMKAAKGKTSVDTEKRTARFIMSTESVDRYRDIVVQAGLDTTRFMENPQGLMFHNSRSWPIGLWTDVEKILTGRPKRTEGTLKFLEEGVEPDADRAFRHVVAGTLRAVSIGFIPDWDEIEMILDDDDQWTGGFRYSKSELIECSVVPIPAQPDALIKDAGGDMKLAKEFIEQVLDNWARDPVTGMLLERKDYEAAYRVVKAKALEDLIVKSATESEESAASESAEVDEVDGSEPEKVESEADVKDVEAEENAQPEASNEETSADENAEEAIDRDAFIEEVKQKIETIVLVETKAIDEATEKANSLDGLLDRIAAKISKIFGLSPEQERIEPKVDTPPSPEAIKAAVSKAKAVRERVAAKGFA